MLRRFCYSIAAALLFAVPAAAQTADEIIGKYIEAEGGPAKLQAVKSRRLTGKMTVGPGIEAPAILEQKRPNRVRLEITVQGLMAVQAFDGANGWQIMPFQGKKDPELMGEDDRTEMEEEADLDGPLVDYKSKGNQVELIGKESVEGGDAYKLKVTLKKGGVRYIYIDPDSFLIIKSESKRMIRGTERETETTFGNYKEVEGLMIAHSIEVGVKGSPNKQKISVDKVEINPAIDDSRFKMPEVKKPEPAKPAEQKPAEQKPAPPPAPG